jgi:hypothetical protein
MLGAPTSNTPAATAAACTPKQPEYRQREAADALCNLIHARCGVFIPTDTMLAMFESDWQKLSTLAHAIHDGRGGC